MKTKIQIKSIVGKLLFEYESEDNSLRKSLVNAVSRNADLRGADLRGADLTGADLTGADLRGAYLTGADLRGADLRDADLRGAYLRDADLRDADLTGAYLTGAYLTGAYLTGADLRGADLRGADLTGAYLRGAEYKDVKIKKAAVFTGLYKYIVMCVITEDGEKWIKMGCYFRTLKEWKSDFWNNDNEFPNDESEKSKLRLFAFEAAKRWFNIK